MKLNKVVCFDASGRFFHRVRKALGGQTTVNHASTHEQTVFHLTVESAEVLILTFPDPIPASYSTLIIEIIKSAKINDPSILIIAIAQKIEVLDLNCIAIEDLYSLGVSGVLDTNFTEKSLKKLIYGISEVELDEINEENPIQKETILKDDSFFTKVPIKQFIFGQKALFNCYIKEQPGKYTLITKAGELYNKTIINHYQLTAGQNFLYFEIEDRIKYVNYANKLAEKIIASNEVSMDQKVAVTGNMVDQYIKEIYTEGLVSETVDLGKSICQNIHNTITQNKDYASFLKLLHDIGPESMDHNFLVTFISNIIAMRFEWESKLITETLGMACMFHDIGKAKLPPVLREKRTYEMSPEEFKLYKKHPRYSSKLISRHRQLNVTVSQIALQHHEAVDGSGFPFGIKQSKILQLARVVFFADQMAHMMVLKQISPNTAFKLLFKDPGMVKKFCPNVLSAFAQICTDKIDKKDKLKKSA